MRLNDFEIKSIKETFLKHFGENDKLWLFGSRVYDYKKGGDIDLYIETVIEDSKIAFDKKCQFSIDVKEKIGDQKIDIVLNLLNSKTNLFIYEVARKEGKELI